MFIIRKAYVSFLVSRVSLTSGLGSDLVEGSSPSLLRASTTILFLP